MQIVLAILYLVVGVLLAIPYCMLAGWSAENFPMVAFVAPAFLFICFLAATFAGIVEADNRKAIRINWRAAFGKNVRRVIPGSLPFFWAWITYVFLPVILHWGAMLLEKVGYFKTIASFLDAHRYPSPLYIFIATTTLLTLTGMITSAQDAAKKVWARIAGIDRR